MPQVCRCYPQSVLSVFPFLSVTGFLAHHGLLNNMPSYFKMFVMLL